MAKRQFNLTQAEVNELKGAYQQCQDGLTKTRYQAVRLYGIGYKVSEIEEISGCSRPSLMEWCRTYRQEGIAGLVDHRRGGNRAKLRPVEMEQLQQRLEDYSPGQLLGGVNCYGDGQFWNVPDLAKLVERDYQVKYTSATSYRSLFKRCNFSCQRPGSQYWSRNELAVLDFEQQLEKKTVDVAQEAPDTVWLASDEASLYLQATLQVVWASRGQTPIIKLDPSRKCTHFYGALNLLSGQQAVVMQTPTMNAEISALFLQKILTAIPNSPIVLLWDKAPWHRGPEITHLLTYNPRLHLICFPTAAPDLNPQEQVWKATRKAVSHNHAGKNLATLAQDFQTHLTSTTFPCSFLHKFDYPSLCMLFK